MRLTPKKLRSAGTPQTSGCDIKRCVICEGDNQSNIRKAASDIVDANLKTWAKLNNNFELLGRLIAPAADVHAGDIYYQITCYLHLRDSSRAANCPESMSRLNLSLIQSPLT